MPAPTIPLEQGTIAFRHWAGTLVIQGPSTLGTIDSFPAHTHPIGFVSDHTKLLCSRGVIVDIATMTYSSLPDTSPSGTWGGGIGFHGMLPNSNLALFDSSWAGDTIPLYTVDILTGAVAATPIDTRAGSSRFCYIDYVRNRIYVAFSSAPYIAVYDATTFAAIHGATPTMPGYTGWHRGMATNPVLQQVAINTPTDGRVYVFNAETGASLYSIQTSIVDHGYDAQLSYSADGTLLAVTSGAFYPARTRIYSADTGSFLRSFSVGSNWTPYAVFTGRGTDFAGHGGPTKPETNKVRDASAADLTQYTLAYTTEDVIIAVAPLYVPPPGVVPTEPFWTQHVRSIEVI